MKEKQNVINYRRQGKSYREIADLVGIDKDTAMTYVAEYNIQRAEYLAANPDVGDDAEVPPFTEKPKYRLTEGRQPRVATAEVIDLLNGYIRDNENLRLMGVPKQQRRIRDMYDDLIAGGHEIGYSTVKRYVCHLIKVRNEARTEEAFIRQEYKPGAFCEFDWCEVTLFIASRKMTFQMAVFAAPFSNYRYAKLFLVQDTAAFMEAHADFFEYSKVVYDMMIYDNAKVQVKYVDKKKEPTEALVRLSTYYGFDYRFCNVRRGNEKSHVERACDRIRHEAFSGYRKMKYKSLDEANAHLLHVCEMLNAEVEDGTSPAEKFKTESVLIAREVPRLACFDNDEYKVDKYSTICVWNNHYSVPDTLVGKKVIARIFSSKIEMWYDGKKVASHMREYDSDIWKIDIFHYLRTLEMKPGALPDSTALSQADTRIKKIYDGYYTTDSKTFLTVLEKIRDKVVTASKVLKALEKLSLSFPKDYSLDRVLEMCGCTDDNAGSDNISAVAESTLPDYDLLAQKQSNTYSGEVANG